MFLNIWSLDCLITLLFFLLLFSLFFASCVYFFLSFPLSSFPLLSFSLCLKRQGILKVGKIVIFFILDVYSNTVVIPKLPPITLFVGKLHLK